MFNKKERNVLLFRVLLTLQKKMFRYISEKRLKVDLRLALIKLF